MKPEHNLPLRLASSTCGFTLVEILIVMLIASIMMGVVVMSIPASLQSGDLKTEAERLQALLEMASEEAVISGSEIGLRVDLNSYLFQRFDEPTGEWSTMVQAPFTERELAKGVVLALEVEGTPLVLGDSLKAPPVLFLSSGEATPFRIYLNMEDQTQILVVASDGFSGVKLGKVEP